MRGTGDACNFGPGSPTISGHIELTGPNGFIANGPETSFLNCGQFSPANYDPYGYIPTGTYCAHTWLYDNNGKWSNPVTKCWGVYNP